MARNCVNTSDRVVTTTSLGNQEKWFNAESNLWYKVDGNKFEALSEAVASEILREHTNAQSLPEISVAKYWIEQGNVRGQKSVFSVSENFKKPDNSIVTVNTILQNALGKDYIAQFNRRASLKERMQYLVETVERSTHMDGFGEYLATLFEIDALILNQDRHLNNIAVISTPCGYKPCPVFDNGASFLLDIGCFRLDVDTKSYISQARALPFKSSFVRSVHTAQELYGVHLKVDFTQSAVELIANKFLQYYPPQLSAYLKERIVTVLMIQQKKLYSSITPPKR